MSDLTIPGATSNQNTQRIITALMDAERVPLKRMEKEAVLQEHRKSALQDMTRKLSGLRDDARVLYGFQNPFNDRVADSSDSRVLTATAARDAVEEQKSITVQKLATADRFLSQSLPRDFKVDPGEYVFKVGDKEVRLAFKGGSLREFVDALDKRGGDLLGASLVPDTPTSQVLLVESKKTGAKNRLAFSDASAELALEAGMLERSSASSRQLSLVPESLAQWVKPLSKDMYSLSEGTLTLNPGSELRIPLTPGIELNPNMVLELSLKTEQIPEPKIVEIKPPPGPAIPETGSIQYGGVTIQSGKSEAPLPELKAPAPTVRVDDMQVLFLEGAGKLAPLPAINDSPDFQKIQVPVGELASAMESLDLRNRNTFRRISVKDISVFDKTQRGEYTPRRALSEAGDAQLAMDGVPVARDSNTIDNLMPGVTLTLKGESSTPVTVGVRPDVEGIKKQILSFIGSYNRIVTQIDILTRKDEKVIDAAAYLTDEEKAKAREDLGLMTGEMSLSQLKESMQRIMMNSYPTALGRELALLAQAGIATDLRKPGSTTGVDWTKLRGYLEVDEGKLEETIRRHPEGLKQLFGNDTNGDLIVNAGVAFSVDTLLRPYVQTAGIYPTRISGLDSEIAREKRRISDYQKHLDDYQASLKRKYAQMEGALNAMQKSSQEIDSFNKRNSQ